jgi:hypothetical protein
MRPDTTTGQPSRHGPNLATTLWLFVTFGDSGSRKQMTTGEEKVADWKILMNQWRNEHSCRDELSHHLVFTKNDEEPTSFTLARNEAYLRTGCEFQAQQNSRKLIKVYASNFIP